MVGSSQAQGPRGVAGGQGESRRDSRQPLHHHGRIEAHGLALNVCPGGAVAVPGCRFEHAHPYGRKNLERRLVDGLEVIGGQNLDRGIGPWHLPERNLVQRTRLAGGPRAAAGLAGHCAALRSVPNQAESRPTRSLAAGTPSSRAVR